MTADLVIVLSASYHGRMGKGNDPNCASLLTAAPMSVDETPTSGPVSAVTEASSSRARGRGKRKEFSDAEKDAYFARVEERVSELTRGVMELAEHPQKLQQWLDDMADKRLWNYSFGNLMLADFQARSRGLSISRLASKSAWRKQGYRIKDEYFNQGLEILAPRTRSVWVDDKDPVTGAVRTNPKTGKPKKKRIDVKINDGRGGVRITQTYDFSMVEPIIGKDGRPIAQDLSSAPATADQAISELSAVAERHGVRVFLGGCQDPEFAHRDRINTTLVTDPDTNGFYTEISDGKGGGMPIIVTRPGLGPQAEARVLAHELAHAVLHSARATGKDVGYENGEDRRRKEVEAEGAAYVISNFYGLDTDRQTKYVATWAAGQEEKQLKAATGSIQRAVKKILGGVEDLRAAPEEDVASATA